MTFAKNRAYGVPEFDGTEVNRHSGNLKGLMGYLQTFHTHIATLIAFRQHFDKFTKGSTVSITTHISQKQPPHSTKASPHIHHHQHIHHKTSSTLSSSHLKTENNNGVEVLLNFLHMENNWN